MALEFGTIEKLYIQAYEDPKFEKKKGEKLTALINPETYSNKFKVEFCETQAPGTSAVGLKYNKTLPQDFNFDFLFDGTGVVKGASVLEVGFANPLAESKNIAEEIKTFKNLVLEFQGQFHRPNYVQINWGTLIFKGVLTSLDIEYKLFKPDGTPLRAIARCSFKETIDEEHRAAKEKKESPDITHERIFSASDRLTLLTKKFLEDQNFYTDVAAANRLDMFRNIKPGTPVFFPPLK